MAIKSTGMSIKSTGQSEKSHGGAAQHERLDDGNPHPALQANPNAHNEGAGKVEYRESVQGDGSAELITPEGHFEGNDAAHEHICKHP